MFYRESKVPREARDQNEIDYGVNFECRETQNNLVEQSKENKYQSRSFSQTSSQQKLAKEAFYYSLLNSLESNLSLDNSLKSFYFFFRVDKASQIREQPILLVSRTRSDSNVIQKYANPLLKQPYDLQIILKQLKLLSFSKESLNWP